MTRRRSATDVLLLARNHYSPTPTQAGAMGDISQILHLELLTEVLERVSVPDVLKFEQVRTLVSVVVLTDHSWCFQVNRVSH